MVEPVIFVALIAMALAISVSVLLKRLGPVHPQMDPSDLVWETVEVEDINGFNTSEEILITDKSGRLFSVHSKHLPKNALTFIKEGDVLVLSIKESSFRDQVIRVEGFVGKYPVLAETDWE